LKYASLPRQHRVLESCITDEAVSVSSEITKEVDGEPRLVRALEQLTSLLVPGETIEACAVQRRFFALTHRRTQFSSSGAQIWRSLAKRPPEPS